MSGNVAFDALNAHAQHAKTHGSYVLTEHEKDDLKRKRSELTATQRIDDFDEDDQAPQDDDPRLLAALGEPQDLDLEDGDQEHLPCLHEYFAEFPDVTDDAVISMCRAYASYLASLQKKKLKRKH